MKIAFASCAKIQDIEHKDVWDEIAAELPDALLLLGDNVYLKYERHDNAPDLKEDLDARCRDQRAEPHFAALLEQLRDNGKPVFACYDDHDFLGNDRYGGDSPASLRDTAREAFIRAWRPAQTGQDVYSKTALGDLDLIVLDTRYYRERPNAGISLSRDAILGTDQWTWLEECVTSWRSKFLMLVSGSTYHNFGRTESWEQYPAAFGRLRDLIGHRSGAFIVTGDIHSNQMYDDSGVVEIVSSGVARKGIVFGGLLRNYGILTFDDESLRVDLRSNKPRWRQNAVLALADWRLK